MNVPPGFDLWPESVAGWLALLGSILALFGVAVTHGRHIETINGLGSRVKDVEMDCENRSAKLADLDNSVRRLLDQHDHLIKALGETRGESIRQREDNAVLGETLGGKLDVLRSEMNEQNVGVRERLASIEARLQGTITTRRKT